MVDVLNTWNKIQVEKYDQIVVERLLNTQRNSDAMCDLPIRPLTVYKADKKRQLTLFDIANIGDFHSSFFCQSLLGLWLVIIVQYTVSLLK